MQRLRGVHTLAGSVNAGWADLRGRLDGIRTAVARAAVRAGRDPVGVALIAAVKQVPVERVRAVLELGVTDLGENRVQEAEDRIAALGRASARWHMIGHLQRNKTGRAVELFDRIQSVDRLELAETIARRASALGRVVAVQLEVNVSGEVTKFGVAPDQLVALARAVARLPGVRLDGLMTIGAPVAEPEAARPGFARLRGLRDQAQQALGVPLPELSMGMSGDFEVAVEEGATMVRIGTALFGAREPRVDSTCS